nr:unnamed protein product [Callosobruchus analis]
MFTLFLEQRYPEVYLLVNDGTSPEMVKCEVPYHYYLRIFGETFNYGLVVLELMLVADLLDNVFKLSTNYIIQRQRYFTKKPNKSGKAVDSEDTETLCWDFQQNIPYPHLAVSDVFYLRQLWLYNFCVYSCKHKKGVMHLWPETEGKRGVIEVLSCLDRYGCRGQTHNNYVVQCLFSLVHEGRLDSIEWTLPIRVHSYLPCDRLFSVIERMKRKCEKIQSYNEWQDLISTKFPVRRLTFKDFLNFKDHKTPVSKKKCPVQQKKVPSDQTKGFLVF